MSEALEMAGMDAFAAAVLMEETGSSEPVLVADTPAPEPVAEKPVGMLGAVRLAKEALGDRPPGELAAHAFENHGLTIKPTLVAVLLGTLREKELLLESDRRMQESALKAQGQPVAKPKRVKRQGPRDAGTFTAGDSREPKSCPACGGDYAFRGRKLIAEEGGPEMVQTKYRCRACECEWRVRIPAAVVGPLGARKDAPEKREPAA